jgi:hypothetical protein
VNPLTRYLLGEDGTLQSLEDRATHHYVIGQPGTGKSRALESWAMQDIADGRGLTFIDPHGDSYAHLVKYVAQMPAVHDRPECSYQPHRIALPIVPDYLRELRRGLRSRR